MTTPNTHVEQVNNAVGEPNPPYDFQARHYTTKVIWIILSSQCPRHLHKQIALFHPEASKHLNLGFESGNLKSLDFRGTSLREGPLESLPKAPGIRQRLLHHQQTQDL